MGVIRPRPPATQNFASDRSANLADRQQIRRLLSQQRAARPAVAGALGGFTRAKPGTVSVTAGGISFSAWDFFDTYDVSEAEKPELTTAGGETFDVVDAGWYFQRTGLFAHINVSTSIDLIVNGASIDSVDPASYAAQWTVPAGQPVSGRYGYVTQVWHGPFWLPGSAASGSGLAPLRVQVGWSGRGTSPSTAFVSCEVDIVRGA